MHALAQRCLDLVRPDVRADANVFVLDDAAVAVIADAWGALPDPFDGADAVMAAALVLLEKPQGRPAAKTLLSLVMAVQPALAARDLQRADALKAKAEQAGAAFSLFSDAEKKGAARVLGGGLLDSGTRPAGTTAASPLARFTLQVPPKK